MVIGRHGEEGQGALEMVVWFAATVAILVLVVLVGIPWVESLVERDKGLSVPQAVYLQASATEQVRSALMTIASGQAATADAPVERTFDPTVSFGVPSPAPGVPTNFALDGAGQAVVSLPIAAQSFSLLVSIDRERSPLNTWAWCLDSSFGLAPNPFDTTSAKWIAYCGNFGVLNPTTGYFDARKNILLDPSWPADAKYFFKVYCFASCAGRVQVTQ